MKLALRHAAIALTMVGVLMATYWALRAAIGAVSSTGKGKHALPRMLPVAPVLLTVGVLVTVLLIAYLHHVVSAARLARAHDGE